MSRFVVRLPTWLWSAPASRNCLSAATVLAAIATIRERVSATVLIHLDVVTEWLVGPPALRSPGGKPGR
jgi:TRAP-type C4-dicarboxylate transport system permease small subunit